MWWWCYEIWELEISEISATIVLIVQCWKNILAINEVSCSPITITKDRSALLNFLFSDYATKIGQGLCASPYQWVLFQYPESGSMPLNWMRIRNNDILSGPLYGIHFYCGEGLSGFPGPLSSRFISSRAHACTGVQPYNQSNRNPAFLFLGFFSFFLFFYYLLQKSNISV